MKIFYLIFKDLQIKLFLFVTIPIFLICIYFILAIDFSLGFPLFNSNLRAEDLQKINNGTTTLCYSYVVSFFVYFLTIILPFFLSTKSFLPYLRQRFRSYCEDWANIYNILNVSLLFNSPIADLDCFVKLNVERTPESYRTIIKSDERCIAFNISEYLNRIEQFHNMVSTNRDSIPSELLSQIDILNSQLIPFLRGRCWMLDQGCKFSEVSQLLHEYSPYFSQQFRQLEKCQNYFIGDKILKEIRDKIPNKSLVQY